MGKIFLFSIIIISAINALLRPWTGIVSYYLLSVLGPQYIWWWNFQGLRVSLIIALSTLAGVVFSLLKINYDINSFVNNQNIWLGLLWFCITISYFFGPYVHSFSTTGLGPEQLFSITNKIFLFYFCATLEINKLGKLRYLIIIFAVSTIYLTYWANYQYLNQNWSQFNAGRLMGPYDIDGGGLYGDENAFAMLFVTGIPFVYSLGKEIKYNFIKIGIWTIIPLCWHAVYLTGSRGGLVGLGIVMIGIMFLSKRKAYALPLMVIFILFYQWQAGSVMVSRSQNIVDFKGEGSAENRITAWKGGLRMIADHPLTGVGIGSFVTALPDYSNFGHMVAHNTLIQFAAESGIVAGIAYLVVVGIFFSHSRKIRRWCINFPDDEEKMRIQLYNNVVTISFSGLITCSMFLSLNVYEIFFLLILLNNSLYHICIKKQNSINM